MAAAGAQVRPERLAKIAARIAGGMFVAHFESLSRERHRAGMAHDFYLTAARSTYSGSVGATAVVNVTAPTGLRQRLKGGPLRPTKTYRLPGGRTYSALWIPVGAAVGRTGGDFRGQLRVIWNADTQKGVAIDKRTKAVLFALVGAVDQQPDPSVIPDPADLRRDIIAGVSAKINAAWQTKHPSD
jgi:hypothetical protein